MEVVRTSVKSVYLNETHGAIALKTFVFLIHGYYYVYLVNFYIRASRPNYCVAGITFL
jgi:hypothetical protein